MQIIYFVIKTHNFFIIFTFLGKNIERVKMTTIFKYFMFGKYGCSDTNARGCCMHVFLVLLISSAFSLSSAFYLLSAISHPRFIFHPPFLIRVLSFIRHFSSAFNRSSAIFPSDIRIRRPYPPSVSAVRIRRPYPPSASAFYPYHNRKTYTLIKNRYALRTCG